MFDSQSSKINKSLLFVLKEGISKDNKEISRLTAEERSLKEEIATENSNIKNNKLEDKEVFFKNKVELLKKRLININNEIKNKKELLKENYTSVKLLEDDIANKLGLQENAKNKFNESLNLLLKNKNNSIKYLMHNKESLFTQIADLKKEHSAVKENIKKSYSLLEKQFDAESRAKNTKITELESNFKSFVDDRNRYLKSLKEGILNEEKKLLNLESGKSNISKRFNADINDLHKKLDFQRLNELKNIEKQIFELNTSRKNAELEIEKSIKNSENELRLKHAEKVKLIESQIASEKQNQSKFILNLQNERENISKQIQNKEKEIESEKKKTVSRFENEISKLYDKKQNILKQIEDSVKNSENELRLKHAEKVKLIEKEIAIEKEKQNKFVLSLHKEKNNIVKQIQSKEKEIESEKKKAVLHIEKEIFNLEKRKKISENNINHSVLAFENKIKSEFAGKLKSIEDEINAEKEKQKRDYSVLQREKENISSEIDRKKSDLEISKREIEFKFKKFQEQKKVELENERKSKIAILENSFAKDSLKNINSSYSRIQDEQNVINAELKQNEIKNLDADFQNYIKQRNNDIARAYEKYNQDKKNVNELELQKQKISKDISLKFDLEIKNLEHQKRKLLGENNLKFVEDLARLDRKKQNIIKNLNSYENQFESGLQKKHSDKLSLIKKEIMQEKEKQNALLLVLSKENENISKQIEAKKVEVQAEKKKVISKYDNDIIILKQKEVYFIKKIESSLKNIETELAEKHNLKMQNIENEIVFEKEKQNQKLIESKREAGEYEKRIDVLTVQIEDEKKKVVLAFESKINNLRAKEAEFGRKIEISSKNFENQLNQNRNLKLVKLDKEIIIEKKKHDGMLVSMKKRILDVANEVSLKQKKFVLLKDQLEVDYRKKRENILSNLDHENKIKLENVQKNIVLLSNKIKVDYSKIKNIEDRFNFEIKEKHKKYLAEKKLLLDNIKAIKNKEYNVNKDIFSLKSKIDELNKNLPVIFNRINNSYRRIKDIDSKIAFRNNHLVMLNKIINNKQKIMFDKEKIQKELYQLSLIIENKLKPVVKWKTRTKEIVKFRTRWKEKIVNRIKWKIKNKLITKIEKQPIEDKVQMEKFLKEIDNLLGKLPKEEIDLFAQSDEFKIYKKIMNQYGVR